MYLNKNPLGGSISADWQLPASLMYLLLANCTLSGPLPNGWRLPPRVRSIVLNDNQARGRVAAGRVLRGGSS